MDVSGLEGRWITRKFPWNMNMVGRVEHRCQWVIRVGRFVEKVEPTTALAMTRMTVDIPIGSRLR